MPIAEAIFALDEIEHFVFAPREGFDCGLFAVIGNKGAEDIFLPDNTCQKTIF